MFGIGLPELAVIAIVAVIVFGPDKLPEFARQAGQFVRKAREFANSARDQLREELGPEYSDLELRDLDPRTFVRKQISAVMEEADKPGGDLPATPPAPRETLPAGEEPPYDLDAT